MLLNKKGVKKISRPNAKRNAIRSMIACINGKKLYKYIPHRDRSKKTTACLNAIANAFQEELRPNASADGMKQKATEIISKASSKIKRIHNELEISEKRGILSRGNDSWIATKVRTLILANDEVPSNQGKVTVENGVVYLMGILTEAEGNKAANVARNVVGVKKVIKVFEYVT